MNLFDRKDCYVLADKGYDSKEFVEAIEAKGGIPVIPSRKNAKQPLHMISICIRTDV